MIQARSILWGYGGSPRQWAWCGPAAESSEKFFDDNLSKRLHTPALPHWSKRYWKYFMLFLMTQVFDSGHPSLECVAVQSSQLSFRVSGLWMPLLSLWGVAVAHSPHKSFVVHSFNLQRKGQSQSKTRCYVCIKEWPRRLMWPHEVDPEKWVSHIDHSAVPQRARMGATCTADYYKADNSFLWKQLYTV